MSTFTNAEVEYLTSQPLGRLATVGKDGRPHVMPVGVFYDPETEAIVVGSAGDMVASKKYRDARDRPDVAVVVDDLASVDPWTPRGIASQPAIEGRPEVCPRSRCCGPPADDARRAPQARLAPGFNTEIRGRAETHTEGGAEVGRRLGAGFPFHEAWISIHPRRVLTWGIDDDSYSLSARDVA